MEEEILQLMLQASASEFGISLLVSDVTAFKRAFYSAKAKHQSALPELENLRLKLRPTSDRVWILHKESKHE